MTLQELENRVYTRADNNYEHKTEFFAAFNTLVMDLNLRMSANFKTVDEQNEVDMLKTVEELTGIPSIMDIIVFTGMCFELQVKEDEYTFNRYETTYNVYVNKYKHLVPQEYRLKEYTDYLVRDSGDEKWEIC